MTDTNIDVLYKSLQEYINELEETFLERFLNDPLPVPDEYKHQVKAYCVLCHAAFEEYFEEVAKKVMIHCIDAWQTQRVASESLMSLIGFYSNKVIDKDEKRLRTSFDYLRHLLDEAKKSFSLDIHDNHGANIQYLKALLEPVAVDISNNPLLLNSLNILARERGEFAHKGIGSTTPLKIIISPLDAKNYVVDCLQLCEEVQINANKRIL